MLKKIQEDTKGDITVSLVFFQKHIHKLLQNINIDAINLAFIERHLHMTISRLIKDYVVLANHTRQQKDKKIPRIHSSNANLNLVSSQAADLRSSIKMKSGMQNMLPSEARLTESVLKRGNTSNMFISLYHSILIEYPGTKKVD